MHRFVVIGIALTLGIAAPIAEAAKPGSGGTPCPLDRQTFAPATAADLQRALDCADAGATITLTAGVVYEGNFTLRQKPIALDVDGTPKRVTIKSSRFDDRLLEQVPQRVGPADEADMAWLKVPARSTGPVLVTELRTEGAARLPASHYRIEGIKFFSSQWVTNLVRLGTGAETLVSELPEDISFDRSYFAGSPTEGTKQGLVANGRDIVVTNSYFKDFKDTANDSQAIIIWNGAGPFRIENNHLEGAGENLMVGGGDPSIPNLVPSDITIRGNYFFKPLLWVTETSTQRGGRGRKWRIKNLFELKNAERVVFDGNVLENNWIQADQQGFAILLSPRNQSGGCSWCRVQHVTISFNFVKNSIAGIKFLATDDAFPSGQLQDVTVVNNLLVNINADAVPGTDPGDRAGRLIQIMNPYPSTSAKASPTGPINVTIDHNTAFSTREFSFSTWDPTSGVTFANNVARHNRCTTLNNCGISGDNSGPGSQTFSVWFKDPLDVTDNILFGAGPVPPDYFPFTTNSFPESLTFRTAIDLTTGNPAPGSDPPDYTVINPDGTDRRGPDKQKVGANWDELKGRIDAAVSGTALP